MTTKTESQKNDALASKEPANITVHVAQQVRSYVEKQTLHLPSNYSPENALKSAFLVLQDTRDATGKSVLESCSKSSIVNALLDMVIQGLNPSKKQCYFIAYANTLTCQRSYFGDIALAKRAAPGIEIYYDVVYEGDELVLSKHLGRTIVARHETHIENIDGKRIIAAYCGVIDANGEDLGVIVMSWDQIQKAWSKSKTYKPNGNSVHNEFPDQMALRTVIRRRLKPIINASSDEMLMQSMLRQEIESAEAEVEEEIKLEANSRMLPVHQRDTKSDEPLQDANDNALTQETLGY